MKRLAIILIAVVIATLAIGAGAAFADNGPHGNYTATTDACAGCHRAHTAQAANLLTESTAYALCISCHDGTGANTNVLDGVWVTDSNPLKGGGFVNTTMDSLANGADDSASRTVTSVHAVEGMTGYTDGTIWGHGANSATPDPGQANYVLECTSCHAQHGMAGVDADGVTPVPTYRILKATPGYTDDGLVVDNTVITPYSATVTDTTTYNYVISDTVHDAYWNEPYYANDDGTGILRAKELQISYFCVRCHDRIYARSSTSAPFTDTGDAVYRYRHTSVGLPSTGGVPRSRQCIQCHVSHGTSAVMSGDALEVPEPGSTTVMQNSALLRLDNRTTCMECHANSIGGPVPPAY